MSQNRLQVSTPTDTTLVLTRTFDAPRRQVWEAMFTPDKMRRWMLPPPGLTLARCDIDASEGGALSLEWKHDDGNTAMTLQGVFTEATPPARAVHTETMATATGQKIAALVETHEFTENDGATTMRITQAYDSKEARDGALASGMDEGMEACYMKLDKLLTPLTGLS